MKIPESLIIGEAVYTIKYVDAFEDVHQMGLCDADLYVITLKQGMPPHQEMAVLIHEILHAVCFEAGMRLKHKHIERLERPLASLIMRNFIK